MAHEGEECTPANSEQILSRELEEQEKQLEILHGKAWFFLDVSYDQIELILKQSERNCFVVTNGTFNQYILYMRIQSLGEELQLVRIGSIQNGGGFQYMVEGKEEVYDSALEAVERFAAESEFDLIPAVDSHRQASMQSQASCELDRPPTYAAAASFPGKVQSLPDVITRVDTMGGEDADRENPPVCEELEAGSNRTPRRGAIRNPRAHRSTASIAMQTAADTSHRGRLCKAFCSKSWQFCCHKDETRAFSSVDFRGSGPCRCIAVVLLWVLGFVFCCPCACLFVAYVCWLKQLSADEGEEM